MKLEPETLFIGVIDFFSVMLPGAVLTYVVKDEVERQLIGVFPKYPSEAAGWAVFLFSSYLLGHFIFLIGAMLDEALYDRIRRATPGMQKKRLEKGKKPAWALSKWLARKLFAKNPDLAVEQVWEEKEQIIPDVGDAPVINAFQWSKAKLTIRCPGALVEVQRFEADSKFFRSFAVVLLLLLVWTAVLAIQGRISGWAALICLALLGLSLWRYIERRFKATQQAYWYSIALEHCPPPRDNKDNP